MNLTEYAAMDAVDIARAVAAGEVSAVEVTEAAIAAIEALNPTLNALVLQDFGRARDRARVVDRHAPLAGVPFLIKDIDVYTEEWPTTMSSRFFATAQPRPDSTIVRRWREAGTVFLGKTNTPEFAADFITEPAFRGVTYNPWDRQRTVGGSSGGAAAAVASGMVPVAHGSDVGGSIRIPAAACGLFGLKPSRGLNPVGPYFGEMGSGLNCEHVISRTVRDSAAFLDVSAGTEPGAPYLVTRSVESYQRALDAPTGRLKVACIERPLDGEPVAPEIATAFTAAQALMAGLGHELVPARFPAAVSAAVAGEGWSVLWLIDIAMAIRERSGELGRPPQDGEIEPLSQHIRRRIARLSGLEYLEVMRLAHRVRLAMAETFGGFDLIMTPATGTLPPTLGTIDSASPQFDFDRWCQVAYRFAPFSEVFNVTGQPAASLPLFLSAAGLPIGIQLIGRQNQDHVVLQVAAALERETGWTRRHPRYWAGKP